jgi:murein DD-endopeptidase MepM/ murein hydrolase activator NlpD
VKRLLLFGTLVLIVLLAVPYARPAFERIRVLYTLARQDAPARLPSPVASAAVRFTDSWHAPRSGGRRHEGIDIFAARGTPVVSTTAGIVTRVGTSRLGGQIVGVLGPGFEWHYYAHLSGFGAFREGDIVAAGDLLGYVGDTGNARGTPPHLHYGLYRGGAINPYPRLTQRGGNLSDTN